MKLHFFPSSSVWHVVLEAPQAKAEQVKVLQATLQESSSLTASTMGGSIICAGPIAGPTACTSCQFPMRIGAADGYLYEQGSGQRRSAALAQHFMQLRMDFHKKSLDFN